MPSPVDTAHHPALPGWVIARSSCPSTNTWALDHIDELRHGDCVWTEHQTAGRGRDGRTWRSPPGVLTASFIVDAGFPDTPRHVPLTRLSLATGLAVIHAVSDFTDASALRIKWPNDVLVGSRKLAGILCETRRSNSGRHAAVIGIGCNLAPRWDQDGASLPFALGPDAPIGLDELGAELGAEVGADLRAMPTPIAFLIALRRYLLEAVGLLAAGTWDPLLSELRQRDALRGTQVRLETGTGLVTGTAQGFADDGALLIENASGVRGYASGHIGRG